ncbi:hypothetical protein LIQ08_19580, partial [[Ruminococcus] gnavus]
ILFVLQFRITGNKNGQELTLALLQLLWGYLIPVLKVCASAAPIATRPPYFCSYFTIAYFHRQ